MAATSIRLPTHGLYQEYRCRKHRYPRYYRLKWEHLTIPVKDVKDALTSRLQYSFYGVFASTVCLSLRDAVLIPFNGLCWDENQGVYLDRSLYIIVDTGVVENCTTASCQQPSLYLQLGDEWSTVESFRTSGLQFYSRYGNLLQDRETVFDRVYREQEGLKTLNGERIGEPVVKCVQYVYIH
ncbi:hypothetical protein COCC4DRAFT_143757 [Bipolaris maydis ATCC 48331]|uniref:Uncharacterized protein n=2 Tax=Cochliobolus heterostrophus TaxID=5016 RepID=M2UFB7_COCH5|nr:uncharacterized protein COCC4DRAFT_143757 [Bipolaris maydis ATCC 48331]EMD86703.1 hypothetical protein COCHEDRAFT_1115490 [Bipolaris maydis C5]ENI03097.1 hypothetical protein COCC4DRAFT_143757 [Bipolaris maydis ATCC 48331]KAJ6267384.1 hypothetical protein PSV08DRAFT_187169 [Bipolaris maydis]